MATIVADIIYKAQEKGMVTVKKKLDGIDKSAKKSEKSTKGLSKAMMAAIPLATIAAAGKLTGVLAEMGRESAKTGDEIVKTSIKLGVSTDKLQEWRFAAEEAGIAQTTMDTSLQRFTRRLGEAQMGTGVLKTSLDALGIGLTNAEGKFKSTDEIMAEWMDKLRNLDKPQQLAHLTKGMDMAGAAASQMLNSLEGSKQKFLDMGLAIDENILKKMAVLNNDLGVMAIQQKNLSTEIGSGFGDVTRQVESWRISVLETVRDVMKLLGMLGDIHDTTNQNLIKNVKLFREQLDTQKKLLAGETDPARIARRKENIAMLERELEIAKGLVEERIKGGGADNPTGGTTVSNTPATEKEKLLTIEEKALKILSDHADIQRDNNLLQQQAGALFAEQSISLEEYILLLEKAGIDREKLSLTPIITKNNDELEKAKEAAIDWQSISEDGVRSLSDAFIDSAAQGSKSFGDMASSIIRDIGLMIAKQMLFNAISGGLSSAFPSLFKSAEGSAYSGGTKYAKGSEFTNKIHRAPTKFAFGGGIGVMGEKSPEAVMPLARTNSGELGIRTSGSGDSGGVQVNVYNSTNGEAKVNQRQGAQGEPIIDVFIEEVSNAIAGDVATGRGAVSQSIEATYGLNRAHGSYS